MSHSKEHAQNEPPPTESINQLKEGLWTVYDSANLADPIALVWVATSGGTSTEYWYYKKGGLDNGVKSVFVYGNPAGASHDDVQLTAYNKGWYKIVATCTAAVQAPKP